MGRNLRSWAYITAASLVLVACGDQAVRPVMMPLDDLPDPVILTPTPKPQATPTPTAMPTSTPVPPSAPPEARFEPALCQMLEFPGVVVQCGYLIVPESRRSPSNATLRLYTVVIRSIASDPAPDPVLYLSGGPGSHAVEVVPFLMGEVLLPLLQERDVIVFDQRGTGLSEPSLACPEDNQVVLNNLATDIKGEDLTSLHLGALAECKERLVKEGVNLDAYNSAENAADIADLREQLGIQEWNLLGVSYGTKLALTTMRDHPAGIRSAILDSAYPLEVAIHSEAVSNVDRALKELFTSCADDTRCDTAFPDLEQKLFDVLELLDKDPVGTTVFSQLKGTDHKVLVNGERFLETVIEALYITEIIPLVPEMIYQAGEGNLRHFDFIAGVTLGQMDFLSRGMFMSVQCADEIPFTTAEEAMGAVNKFPRLRPYIDVTAPFDFCGVWNVSPSLSAENQPVSSGIPTLILAGQYDPVTPPSWGRQVQRSLSSSYLLEFPGNGHGVVFAGGGCNISVAIAFLAKPNTAPDDSCVSELAGPRFVTPVAEDLRLIPFQDAITFQDQAIGISGVVPEEWVRLGPGVYGKTKLGLEAIVQQLFPATLEGEVTADFAAQLGLERLPESAQTLKVAGLGWDVYQMMVQGQPVDAAISDNDRGVMYLVILTVNPENHDLYYKDVFLPVLGSVKAIRPE